MKFSNYKCFVVLFVATCVSAAPGLVVATDDGADKTSREAALKRVSYDIKYLASDELEGRQPGTPGIELAVKYIIGEYEEAGLKGAMPEGGYLQEFSVDRGRILDKSKAVLTLSGPDSSELKLQLNQQFVPQLNRKNYDINADLVFVGYGITAEDHNYDDYLEQDVDGKVVVLIRREPQQDNPDSVFDGKEISQYSYIQSKIAAARKAKAAAIIMVNDGMSAPSDEKDALEASDQFGQTTSRMPFVHVKRSVINEILKQTPVVAADGSKLDSLKKIEAAIDESLEPVSQPLAGWTAKCAAEFKPNSILTSNVVGVVEGEGPNAEETIVIGAHYDHLGMGAYGSRAPGRREIHNGADDNASGTAAVIELARRFAKRDSKPGRRLVFVCFSAEEMGLLGARHYVDEPIYPLDKTVAMVNFDMIGWLREDKLTVFNWNSAKEFNPVLDRANEGLDLDLNKPPSGFAGSDHLPFYNRQIPVMFLHTGITGTYHTPEDDFETLDCDGALKVIEYTERVIDGLAGLESAPKFVARQARAGGGIRLGVRLETSEDPVGARVIGVSEDSFAAKAGLLTDDVIIGINDDKVESRRVVRRLVRSKAGETIKVTFLRAGQEKTVDITLKNEEDEDDAGDEKAGDEKEDKDEGDGEKAKQEKDGGQQDGTEKQGGDGSP